MEKMTAKNQLLGARLIQLQEQKNLAMNLLDSERCAGGGAHRTPDAARTPERG
jgi:hypothetical protein